MSKFVDWPRYGCALAGALALLRAIPRTIPIIHSSTGCGFNCYNGTNAGAGYLGGGYCGGAATPSSNVVERHVVFGGEVRVLATASIAQDLGMEIVGLKGHHADEFLLPLFETLDNADEIPINIATQRPFEQANIIERVKPDVIIIHTGGNSISAKRGLPLLPPFSPSINYLGYSGEHEMARRLSRIVRNASPNHHLSQFCPKPFKQSWYEENAFKYIKEG